MSEIVSWVLKMWGRRGAPEHGGRRVSSLKGPPGSQAPAGADELSEQRVDLVVGLGQRFRRSLAQQDLVNGRCMMPSIWEAWAVIGNKNGRARPVAARSRDSH